MGSQHVLPYIENNFPTFCGTSGSYDGLTTLSFEYETELKEGGDPRNAMRSIGLFVRNGLSVTRLVDGVTNESDNYVDLAKYLFQSGNRLADDLIDNSSLTASAKFTDANGFFLMECSRRVKTCRIGCRQHLQTFYFVLPIQVANFGLISAIAVQHGFYY